MVLSGYMQKIPKNVIRRLPRYYRYLWDIKKEGRKWISSRELGEKMGLTASQIRQDFNFFGSFGQQHSGYNVDTLHGALKKILGIHKDYNIVIIGAGNVGQALANYGGFNKEGFHIKAIFDVNPRLIGLRIRDVEILDIGEFESFLADNTVHIAVICVPPQRAQEVADLVIKNNIRVIWNITSMDIKAPPGVIVENLHLTDSLLYLSCKMNLL